MDLQEEYFIRNKIDDSLIRYNTGGTVILRQKDALTVGNKWKMLNITAINKEGIPGKFEKRFYVPYYNGAKNYGAFINFPEFNEVNDSYYWEDYEEKLNDLRHVLRSNGLSAITDPKDIDLACWEILLYSHDSCIIELPDYFHETFHKVLDDESSISQKHADFCKSLLLLKNSGISDNQVKLLSYGWNAIFQLVDSKTKYAYWLAKFIGE